MKNQASKKVCNNLAYFWMCNYCLQIKHMGLVLHNCVFFVYFFQIMYNWVHPNWSILVRVIVGHSTHWFPNTRITKFVLNQMDSWTKKNRNEICIHDVFFKVNWGSSIYTRCYNNKNRLIHTNITTIILNFSNKPSWLNGSF